MYGFHFSRWYYVIVLAMMIVLPVSSPSAQTEEPVTPNLSQARVHVAGPNLVFLDGVAIDGEPYAVYLSADDAGQWRVTALEAIETRRLPQDVFLDMASLSVTDGGALQIADIYLDGRFYSGTVTFDSSFQRVQNFQFQPTDPPEPADHERLSELAEVYGIDERQPAEATALTSEPASEPAPETPAEDPSPAPPSEEVLSMGHDTILNRLDEYAAEGAARLQQLETRIDALSQQVASAVAEGESAVHQLMGRVTDASITATAPSVDAMAPTLSLARARGEMATVDPIDLEAGEAVSGRWETEGSETVVQTDPEARFAKLVFPYRQDSRPRLYRMVTRAVGDGWAGVGMHLGVTEVQAPAGYGHGRSVLVWLTRDARTYGDETTFLEVYISYDDVTMNRVAQSALNADLSDTTALEVLMDPGVGMLTVAVDGVEQFRYRVNMAHGTGLELALRALGQGEFSSLEVRRH